MALFHNALPAGYEFDGYRVERVLGAGAFGITYLVEEVNLGRKMAVKEYLPSDIAMRSADGVSVHAIRSTDSDTYDYGLEQFVEEARTLVRFQHPNIVPFHRLVEANGTAYVVMEYQEGRTLAEVLEAEGALDEAGLKRLVLPLLDGLSEVHRQGYLHRDIKPDNIFVREDGRPMLIDFGAAREALSRHSLKPTAILTPGYAPFEQYSSEAEQGPYTDIYAMGATMYRAAFGRTPPEATTRMMNDTLVPALEAGAGRFDDATLAAIDAALSLQPGDRPQTIADLQKLLAGATIVAADARIASQPITNPEVTGSTRAVPVRRRSNGSVVGVAALVFLMLAIGGGYWAYSSYQAEKAAQRIAAEETRRAGIEAERKSEAARKAAAEEVRMKEEKRKAEAERKANEKREAEEKKKAADERRRIDMQRAKLEAERKRIAEAKRKAEIQARLAREKAQREAEAHRRAAEATRSSEGQVCRTFTETITLANGRTETINGKRCQGADGSWSFAD